MLSVKNYIRTFVRKPSGFVQLAGRDPGHHCPSRASLTEGIFPPVHKKMGAQWAPIYVLALSAPALFRIHPVDPTLALADLHLIA